MADQFEREGPAAGRVVAGDLLKPGPASAWFDFQRPLVGGESNSPFVHAVSAADLASGISAVVDLRVWTFINADLTIAFWRVPEVPRTPAEPGRSSSSRS